jgi:hypothetical protein
MTRRLSPFNVTSLVLGFAFLYLPILLLIVLVVPIVIYRDVEARRVETGS